MGYLKQTAEKLQLIYDTPRTLRQGSRQCTGFSDLHPMLLEPIVKVRQLGRNVLTVSGYLLKGKRWFLRLRVQDKCRITPLCNRFA